MTMTQKEIHIESCRLGQVYANKLFIEAKVAMDSAVKYHNKMTEMIAKCQ